MGLCRVRAPPSPPKPNRSCLTCRAIANVQGFKIRSSVQVVNTFPCVQVCSLKPQPYTLFWPVPQKALQLGLKVIKLRETRRCCWRRKGRNRGKHSSAKGLVKR